MRKTITGTGGMLLLQTLKKRGGRYLFTNPGSAETGNLRGAGPRPRKHRLVVGKHEGLVARWPDGYHRISGKVASVIAHVMGGFLSAGGAIVQNAQHAGSALSSSPATGLRAAGFSRASPAPRPSQAESMRPLTKDARAPTPWWRIRRPFPWPPRAR